MILISIWTNESTWIDLNFQWSLSISTLSTPAWLASSTTVYFSLYEAEPAQCGAVECSGGGDNWLTVINNFHIMNGPGWARAGPGNKVIVFPGPGTSQGELTVTAEVGQMIRPDLTLPGQQLPRGHHCTLPCLWPVGPEWDKNWNMKPYLQCPVLVGCWQEQTGEWSNVVSTSQWSPGRYWGFSVGTLSPIPIAQEGSKLPPTPRLTTTRYCKQLW